MTPQAASGAGLESPKKAPPVKAGSQPADPSSRPPEPKDPPNKKRPGALRSPPPKQTSPTPKEDVKTEAAEAGSASDRKLVDPIGSSSEGGGVGEVILEVEGKEEIPEQVAAGEETSWCETAQEVLQEEEYGDRVSFKTPIATVVNDEKKDTATPGQQQAPKGKKGQGKERQKGKGKGFQKGGGKQKGKEKSAKKGGKRKGQKKGKGAWGAGEPRRSGETW